MELPCITTVTAKVFPPLNRIALLTRYNQRTIAIYIATSEDKENWKPCKGFDYVEDITLHNFYRIIPSTLLQTITSQNFNELINKEDELNPPCTHSDHIN